MALLSLRDIGKIYVSDTNVTVGIRGVSLEFEKGEFVAITGKSGSGKSTLLNVISGMDTYEEGELFIEGEPTSHYLQPEWEAYREKYVSFIFQDYNIIESFTVLQNVELALMHIEDKRARRQRAMELIERVGLSSHVHHKGSKLSGGQKQRTVIARALAKDSPIILADEPTGNLDSATSREIISLLREVSKDKLLIVVTHNFDQVAECATRHVRIFDGAVEFDHRLRAAEDAPTHTENQPAPKKAQQKRAFSTLKNGAILGRDIFTARPRLSVFLCFLMIIGAMGIFLSTSLFGGAGNLFKKNYMFTHIEGRVVLAKQSGEILTDEELKNIVSTYGAASYLHYDSLLDKGLYQGITIPSDEDERSYRYIDTRVVYGKDYGKDIIGRYPEKSGEVFLYLPIAYRDAVGKKELKLSEIVVGDAACKVVGVKYFVDNNLPAECLLTETGFRAATACEFLSYDAQRSIFLTVTDGDGNTLREIPISDLSISFDMPSDKVYVNSISYHNLIASEDEKGAEHHSEIDLTIVYHKYNFYGGGETKSFIYSKEFTDEDITDEKPTLSPLISLYRGDGTVISDELAIEIAESVLADSYKQASLFFENDRAAHAAAERLQDAGYIAVPSDTTHELDGEEAMLQMLSFVLLGAAWLLAILFLAFFISLCTARILSAFKGDMAIMRSMGIPVKVIRIGMYFRMMIALIPAVIVVALAALLIFTTPKFNLYFTYLYGWQYALIAIGMLLLTAKTTHSQIKRLFGESVKKSLKGGAEQ